MRRPRRVHPYLLALVGSLVVAAFSVGAVLDRAGGPALPLDDSFIHLQFARRLAEGHWFSYVDGAGYSSGATSLLWPLCIAPWFVLGLEDLQLVWVLWGYGVLLHAAVAYEAGRLAQGLAGVGAGLTAAAMCLVFGANAWFAFSGMETIAITWVLVRGARLCSEQAEQGRRGWQLAALALLAPLVRPEGALVSLMVACTSAKRLWLAPRTVAAWQQLAMALSGPALLPLAHWLATGHAASSTTMVKWLPLDPYLDRPALVGQMLDNAELMVTNLLDGGAWTSVFLPEGAVWPLLGGLVALPLAARREGRWWRAAMIGTLCLATLAPCSYATMLWNRVRYIWPFAPGWFVAASVLFAAIGRALGRRYLPLGTLGVALSWGAVATLAAKLPWAVSDLAQSARAIARQQVTLGRWARAHLPPSARIAVNDTGAIAYLSRRRTFDVVGLTTEDEARYWLAGAGSRFEHYERLPRSRLFTHLFVYTGWMRTPALYGDWLTDATVLDQSILGGRTMTAFRARHDLLGSGSRPFSRHAGALVDELDVADLESELAHDYLLLDAAGGYNVAHMGPDPRGRTIADGGRKERAEDRFTVSLDRPSRMVMRIWCEAPLEVWADGKRVGEARTLGSSSEWMEHAVDLPAGVRQLVVRAAEPVRFSSYHYWWFAR